MKGLRMKVTFDFKDVDSTLLAKLPSNDKLAAYKSAKLEYEKTGSRGKSPIAPPMEEYTPLQLVELVCVKAIKQNCKSGKTDQLNHLLALFSTLSKQAKENETTFSLPETDIKFIRKSIAKTEWPTDNDSLIKFILSIEKSFANPTK